MRGRPNQKHVLTTRSDPDLPDPDPCAGTACQSRPPPGAGDCNHDLAITIDELVLGVDIALGKKPLATCPAFDTDQSGAVLVDELLLAVRALLRACATR